MERFVPVVAEGTLDCFQTLCGLLDKGGYRIGSVGRDDTDLRHKGSHLYPRPFTCRMLPAGATENPKRLGLRHHRLACNARFWIFRNRKDRRSVLLSKQVYRRLQCICRSRSKAARGGELRHLIA